MLNLAPLTAQAVLPQAASAPTDTAPSGDAPSPFAQALDQAGGERHKDTDKAAKDDPRDASTRGRVKAAPREARGFASPPAHAPQPANPHKTSAVDTDPAMAAPAATATAAASPIDPVKEAASPPAEDTVATAVEDSELLDLTGLLPGLTLPPTPAGTAAAHGPTSPNTAIKPGGEAPNRRISPRDAMAAFTTTEPRATAKALPPAEGEDPSPVSRATPAATAMSAAATPAEAQAAATTKTRATTLAATAPSQETPSPIEGMVAPRRDARETVGRVESTVAALPSSSPPVATAPTPTMTHGLAPAHAQTPTLQAELSAVLGSPEFVPALGTQLSVLVRDGIEHAQLRLNPANMGPLEVRISLDGSDARVDFHAAHADTRQILQDAVPTLAGALRESGLTLTGGGVFDQPRDPRGEPRPDVPNARAAETAAAREVAPATHAPAARSSRIQGVVDLYA